MELNEILNSIFQVVIIPLLTLLTGFAVKWINAKANNIKSNTKDHMVQKWATPNNVCVAAFDGNKIVGCAQICKIMPDHPFSGRNAITGTTLLEKYTSMGLGTKFKQIVEEAKRYLEEFIGDLDEYIKTRIEEQVKLNKTV